MTVKELIARLSTCEKDADVFLGAPERSAEIEDVCTPVPEMVFLQDERKPRPAGSILEEAARIRSGERNVDYGDAVESFERVAEIANAITGLSLTPAECCKVLIAVKLTRERYNHKRDNLVDACGYIEILHQIEERTLNDNDNDNEQ